MNEAVKLVTQFPDLEVSSLLATSLLTLFNVS
jgi:hypothetical protein